MTNTRTHAIAMTKADWENIVFLIGNTDCIGILGVEVEPYQSADDLVAAVKALPSDKS